MRLIVARSSLSPLTKWSGCQKLKLQIFPTLFVSGNGGHTHKHTHTQYTSLACIAEDVDKDDSIVLTLKEPFQRATRNCHLLFGRRSVRFLSFPFLSPLRPHFVLFWASGFKVCLLPSGDLTFLPR